MADTYFIFEDSSQNFHGGGQRITRILIDEILKKKKKLYFLIHL